MVINFPIAVLIVGFCGALLGGSVMYWITRNLKAAAIVGFAGLLTALIWLLQGIFE